MEHTQDKWKIFYNGEIHTDKKQICTGLGFESFKEFIDNKEAQANAQLIVTAPELLKACKLGLLTMIEQHQALKTIIKAIAKKTGIEAQLIPLPPIDILEQAINNALKSQ